MPNLENLKKQAKQYLRWHRERYHAVAAEIRAALLNFSTLTIIRCWMRSSSSAMRKSLSLANWASVDGRRLRQEPQP